MNFSLFFVFSFLGILSSSMLNYVIWFSIMSIMFYFLLMEFNPSLFGDFPIKYFIQEAISSIILLFGLLVSFWLFYFLALLMKLAIPPFHSWFLDLIKKMPFYQVSVMLTMHKFYPLIFCFMIMDENFLNYFLFMLFFVCLLLSLKTDLKELILFSSFISSLWILVMAFYILNITFVYMVYILIVSYLFYTMLEYYPLHINFMYCLFLVSGLPPTIIWVLKIMMMSYLSLGYLLFLTLLSGLSIYLYFYVFSNQFMGIYKVMSPMKKSFLWFPLFLSMNIFIF